MIQHHNNFLVTFITIFSAYAERDINNIFSNINEKYIFPTFTTQQSFSPSQHPPKEGKGEELTSL